MIYDVTLTLFHFFLIILIFIYCLFLVFCFVFHAGTTSEDRKGEPARCDNFLCDREVWSACHRCYCFLCFDHAELGDDCMAHNVAFVNNTVSGDQFSCLVDMSCSNSNEMILTNTYTSNQVAANRKQVPFVEEPTLDTQPSGQLSAGENLVNITEELSAILSEFPTEDAQIPNQLTANGSQVNFAKEPPVIISEVPMEDALAVNADDEHTSSKLTGTGDHCQLLDVEVPTTAIPVDAPTSNQLTSEESQVEGIEACTAEERSYHQCTPDRMHDHTALCPEAFTVDGIPREDIDDKAKEMKSRNFNVKRKRNSGESYETEKK